jgi:hypothetical protein
MATFLSTQKRDIGIRVKKFDELLYAEHFLIGHYEKSRYDNLPH